MSDASVKHIRYQGKYKSNDYFWGIGIENETYFQFSNPKQTQVKEIYNNHKPERYSVNYFSGLNPEYKTLLRMIYPVSDSAVMLAHLTDSEEESTQLYTIPIYMNSHTLQKTDLSGNHQTTYERKPQPNPAYQGKTLHDHLVEINPAMFSDKYNVNYMYDGDTIEFMTQNFYKTTVKQNVNELITEKKQYLEALNAAFSKLNVYQDLGPVIYPTKNEPFVFFLTNLQNIAIFNNGTYHLNFTMPTQLDNNGKPKDPESFIAQHKAAIRYIQYLEPFIIALYGTPDPFSSVSSNYSKASQRCAVSRYIGIGTYDTNTMSAGKILTIDVSGCIQAAKPYWWYTTYTKDTHYKPLDKIGVDINFNKHGTHGIELRFLDWFPETQLEQLMNVIVNVMDYSLMKGLPEDPTVCPLWNGLVVEMLKNGPETTLNDETYQMYVDLFTLKTSSFFSCCFNKPEPEIKTIKSVYETITKRLKQVSGPCKKYML